MTSKTMSWRLQAPAIKNKFYLVNPFYDLMFVCGGLVLVLSIICLPIFGTNVEQAPESTPLILLGILGTYLLSGPHSAATLFKLYGERQNHKRFPLVAYILPVILALAFAAGLVVPAVAATEAALYLILIWHHVMAQSYGIALMYCARSGRPLTPQDKVLPKAILYLAATTAIAQQFTVEWERQFFLGVPLAPMTYLPSPLITSLKTIFLVAVAVFLVEQWTRSKRTADAMPLPAIASLLSAALFLSMGRQLSEIVWLFVPAFFHASQYLSVVCANEFSRDKSTFSLTRCRKIQWASGRFSEYFIAGVVLFTVLPFLISRLGFPLYLCSALAFFSVNLHHFAADSCIWKQKSNTTN